MVPAMTVCWVQQHCPSRFFVDHNCVWPGIVLEEQHFWHSSCGTNSMKLWIQTYVSVLQSEFHVIPQGKKFTSIWLLIPKNVPMIFPADSTLLNFLFLGYCHVVTSSPQLLYFSLQKTGVRCFPCHSVHLYKNFWCLEIAKLGQPFWTESKWEVIEWQNTVFSRKEKFNSVTLAAKIMVAVVCVERGGICVKFLDSRTTVNSACYTETRRSFYSNHHFVYFTQ